MSAFVRTGLFVRLYVFLVVLGMASPVWAQDPFLSYDFEDEVLDDFVNPRTNDLCGDPLPTGAVTVQDGELLITNDELGGTAMFALKPDVVQASFPAARNYKVRLRFNLETNLELAVFLKARLGTDEGTDTADSQLERGYAFTVFPEAALEGQVPGFAGGAFAIAEWSACHELIAHADWPVGIVGVGWFAPEFPIIAGEWYWLELSVQGDDDAGPVILTGTIWEDGEDPPDGPQLVVTDPDGLNLDESTRAPEAEVQMFVGTGFDLGLNVPLFTTRLDDISLTEIEVACAGGLSCTQNQETDEVTLSWSKGVGFQGALELRRGGEVIATPGLDEDSFVDAPGEGLHEYELIVTAEAGVGQDQCSGTFFCRARITGESTFFFDDFNAYSSDDDLTGAGWEPMDANTPVENATFTVTNPGSRANPPTVDGRPTTGGFLVSDSDAADGDNPTGSGMSHDIWSPSFNCAGADRVWLHADVLTELNNNGKAVFDVDVSIDGGESWENVFRRVAPARTEAEPFVDFDNADNFFGRLDVDLSAQAANQSDVQVRFRHFEPNDDWWIAIDNVLVDATPVTGGNVVVLATETFDDEIPDDWVLDAAGDGGDAPWDVLDPCLLSLQNAGGEFPDSLDGRALHHLDESFALVSSFCSGVLQDDFLVTPTLDCSQLTKVYLHFESDVLIDDGGTAVEEVLVSLDGGNSYEEIPIFSYQGGGGGMQDTEVYYNEFVLEVPRAAGQAAVAFAFHYQTPPGETSFWGIDNVEVTGESDGSGPIFVRGDFTADGGLDITDPIALLNFLFGGAAGPSCFDSADSDDGGSLDITDPILVLSHLFAGGAAPTAPFPDCGADPTDDDLDCAAFAACEG